MRTTSALNASLLIVGLLALTASVGARPIPSDGRSGAQQAASPSPVTVDQIVHNIGNIVTTVDNYGYIGGYESFHLPSGEWPRNSGRSYIGELLYWFGGVTEAGDTVVVDAYNDFQAIPSIISGGQAYKILLSTDTTRFYQYDPADTVGLGRGNPARGWREWNADSAGWVYATNFNPTDSSFAPGGPVALQVSHYRFNDAATGSSALGLEFTHSIYQWNYCYNENFMFVVLEIANTSASDLTNCAFALYADIDVGGPDGTGENGRLEDVIAYDTTENLAWTYDSKGWDAGWGGPSVRTGIMGTKYLETPDGIGMTSIKNQDWALIPRDRDDDIDMYEFMTTTDFDQPLPPGDQVYLQCTRGIDLPAGKTIRVVYALIAGEDEEDFRANAALAQELYDNHFVGPQPPVTPTLRAQAGHRSVFLQWNDTAESSVDPLSLANDFAGYKLYRSDNQGKTWGVVDYNTGNDCLTIDYEPIGVYTVSTPGDPIVRSFIDTGLANGVEYWYCLAAFDTGASSTGVDPLQTGFGLPGQAINVAAATPRTDPAGFYESAGTVDHQVSGQNDSSDGAVFPIVFDRTAVVGADYAVSFEDLPSGTVWHLVNLTSGDTVLAAQSRYDGDPGLYEIADGLRVVVRNGERTPRRIEQTGFGGTDTSLIVLDFYGPAIPVFTGDPADIWTDAPYRNSFELRYSTDSTVAPSVIAYWVGGPLYRVPFEVWNTTTNTRVSLAVYDFEDDGDWDSYDLLTVVDFPYDAAQDLTAEAFPNYYGWMFGLDDASFAPSAGDILTITGAPLNGPADQFLFRPDGINAAQAAVDLSNIKVVPNPYVARYSPMVEVNEGQSVLEFQKLPGVCTIRIYSLSGDLVAEVTNEDGDGTARWNLLTASQRQIASGTYLYHVESEFGEHRGRFSVIK